jgi:hypothetical protein
MDKFLKGFFWLAFATFLLASIPHVAYFFRSFEPQGDGLDLVWWGVSFLLAASIDVTILLLTVTVIKLHRRGNSRWLIGQVWLFILALTAFSWFVNWEYAKEFESTMLAHVSGTTLAVMGFSLGTVGTINPLLASMFQVLAVMYTWISDKITADTKPKSAAELKAEADELEALAREKERIAAIKRASNKGMISGLGDMVKHARAELKGALKTGEPDDEKLEMALAFFDSHPDGTDEELAQFLGIARPAAARFWRLKAEESGFLKLENSPEQNASLPTANSDSILRGESEQNPSLPGEWESLKRESWDGQNEASEPGKTGVKPFGSGEQKPDSDRAITDAQTVLNMYPKLAQIVSTGALTLTKEELSEAVNMSPRKIQNRVNDGTLKTAPRNDKRITINSVLRWLKPTLEPGQNGNITAVLPGIKLLSSPGENEPITGELQAIKIISGGDEKAS